MCCDNKCLFFIKVRTGSLIFGYIAAVISGIGVLVGVGISLYLATYIIVYSSHNNLFLGGYIFLLQIFFIENTAGFTFSVLLLYGLTKNKPVLVKTYIIYGMIQLVLDLVVMIILFCCCVPLLGVLGLFLNGIYTLFIYMVYLTYKIMVTESERASFTNPPNLLLA